MSSEKRKPNGGNFKESSEKKQRRDDYREFKEDDEIISSSHIQRVINTIYFTSTLNLFKNEKQFFDDNHFIFLTFRGRAPNVTERKFVHQIQSTSHKQDRQVLFKN